MDEKTIYKFNTKSLDELAVMLASGADLVKVDRTTRFYTFFLESEKIDLEQISLQLASKKLVMNAAELLSAYKRAKSVSHSRDSQYLDNRSNY